MGAEQGRLQGVPTPAGIQSMDESLQKKFSKGIQFNSESTSIIKNLNSSECDWYSTGAHVWYIGTSTLYYTELEEGVLDWHA